MREINVEYNGGVAVPEAAVNGKKRRFGIGSLVVTAAIAVAVSLLLSFLMMTLTLPRMADSLGYARKSDIPAGTSQNITIVPNGDCDETEAAAAKVSPSVVEIAVITADSSSNSIWFFGKGASGTVRTECSGIIIREDGYILTSYHTVKNALGERNTVAKGCAINVFLCGDNVAKLASVVGYDPDADIAVLRIDASGLTPAEIGDPSAIRAGQRVIATGGNSHSEICSVTAGSISYLEEPGDDDSKPGLIRTDALINTANCGGALVNMQGQVIGVNCLKNNADNNDGLGAAILIDEAMAAAEKLIGGKDTAPTETPEPQATPDGGQSGDTRKGQAFLGIRMDTNYTESAAQLIGRPAGARVIEAMEGLAADKAGIRAQDIITAIDGRTVVSGDELAEEMQKYAPGDRVRLTLWRATSFSIDTEGETLEIDVTLGERPEGE